MTDDRSEIAQLWNSQWSAAPLDVSPILSDRFTAEAYREIAAAFPESASEVLEAGCGTGRFSSLLAHAHPCSTFVGVDVSTAALETANRIAASLECRNVTFGNASIFELPFADGSFDYVFNEGVIPLFSEHSTFTYEQALREMSRVLKPGGVLLVSAANWYCFPHTLYKWYINRFGPGYELGYEKSFRHGELRRALLANGLRNVRFSGFYPSYGFYRLSRKRPGIAGTTLWSIGSLIDSIDGPWLARRFGFQVVVVANK